MNPELKQAWSETIIDHSQFPRRHGSLETATHAGKGENPFCGDRIQLQLEVDEQGRVADARFQATGCAISTASASMLVSAVVGRTVGEAETLFEEIHGLLAGVAAEDTCEGDLAALQLVRQYPARVKCATLAWHVLHRMLLGEEGVATTE